MSMDELKKWCQMECDTAPRGLSRCGDNLYVPIQRLEINQLKAGINLQNRERTDGFRLVSVKRWQGNVGGRMTQGMGIRVKRRCKVTGSAGKIQRTCRTISF